jgi:hypothetical protein
MEPNETRNGPTGSLRTHWFRQLVTEVQLLMWENKLQSRGGKVSDGEWDK